VDFAVEMKAAGFDFVVHANDAAILREAAQRGVKAIRG
jgi:hypothetical protein